MVHLHCQIITLAIFALLTGVVYRRNEQGLVWCDFLIDMCNAVCATSQWKASTMQKQSSFLENLASTLQVAYSKRQPTQPQPDHSIRMDAFQGYQQCKYRPRLIHTRKNSFCTLKQKVYPLITVNQNYIRCSLVEQNRNLDRQY